MLEEAAPPVEEPERKLIGFAGRYALKTYILTGFATGPSQKRSVATTKLPPPFSSKALIYSGLGGNQSVALGLPFDSRT